MRATFAFIATLALSFAGCSGKDSPGPTEPPAPGWFTLRSVPGSATVRLDGAASGPYTTASFNAIAAGNHQVSLSLLGYADTTITITVPSNATGSDTVALRPLPGTPRSISEVWGDLFQSPGPLAIASDGRVYLTGRTDAHVDVLFILSAAGVVLHQVALPASGNAIAIDLVVDSQGRAYLIPEALDDYIHVLSSTGVPQSSISSRGTGSSFTLLAGLAIGPGDTLHVSARDAFGVYVVEKYTASGFAYAFPTGNAGAGPIEVDAAGNIYLGSGPSATVPQMTKFSRTGALLQTWPVPDWPFHITKTPDGHVLVSSLFDASTPSSTPKAPGRIRKVTGSGAVVAEWGVENETLVYLQRHAVDGAGNVFVPLFNDRRVLRFAF